MIELDLEFWCLKSKFTISATHRKATGAPFPPPPPVHPCALRPCSSGTVFLSLPKDAPSVERFRTGALWDSSLVQGGTGRRMLEETPLFHGRPWAKRLRKDPLTRGLQSSRCSTGEAATSAGSTRVHTSVPRDDALCPWAGPTSISWGSLVLV